MLIKICGMTRQQDVDAAAAAGANWCGFIFHPASPRHILPEKAAAIRSGHLCRIGVFVRQNVSEILDAVKTAKLDLVQLHGSYSIEDAMKIGRERVIRVLWPQKTALLEEAKKYAGSCAWFLLDAGSGGGTGQCLDWPSLKNLELSHPWILAGGLKPDNLAEAIRQCRPTGVDLNSGLETRPGEKNHVLIKDACRLAALEDNK